MGKKIIKIFVCVMLCILVLFAVFGVYAFINSQPVKLEKDLSVSFVMDATMRDMLYYASLAPSAYNAQPWKAWYNPHSRNLAVLLDEQRVLPEADPENRAALLALGAFLENFRQAASAYGYVANITFAAEVTSFAEPVAVMDILFLQENPDKDALLERMQLRNSNKQFFERKIIPEATVDMLLEKYAKNLHYYNKDTIEYQYIAQQSVVESGILNTQPEKHLELVSWFRFSDKEVTDKRDGLSAELLGISGLKKYFYYLLFDRADAESAGFLAHGAEERDAKILHNAGFFMVTGGVAMAEIVQTGVIMEAFWLDAVDAHIALQPVSVLLENKEAAEKLIEQLQLPDGQVPQIIFRAGMVSDYGKNARIRRNIASFVEEKK